MRIMIGTFLEVSHKVPKSKSDHFPNGMTNLVITMSVPLTMLPFTQS